MVRRFLHKTILYVNLLLFIWSLNCCGGCSKSGLKEKAKSRIVHSREYQYLDSSKSTSDLSEPTSDSFESTSEKTIVNFENESGVKYIWVEINGIKLKFIFDTGASTISISSAEAKVLYRQGTLKKEDFLDIEYFQDATGKISPGTIINLRTVKIGDRVLYNVKASIVDNFEAPLLLGQSALEQFGKITIDNNNNVIIFE